MGVPPVRHAPARLGPISPVTAAEDEPQNHNETESAAPEPNQPADYLYVPEFGKLNMLGDARKLLDESFVTATNVEGIW